jgi:hemerythrin-like domain-containing protein
MDFHRQTSRALHEEHLATIALLGRVEQTFARGRADDAGVPSLARTFAEQLEGELTRHFAFEENELFPRLDAAGEGDIAGLLTEEHVTIRAVAGELLPLIKAAAQGTLAGGEWDTLRQGIPEIVERLVAHIQKESMALLPMLDDLLDEDTDRELAFAYASG